MTEQDLLDIATQWQEEFRQFRIFNPMVRTLRESYDGRLEPTAIVLSELEKELHDANTIGRASITCQEFERRLVSMNHRSNPQHVLSSLASYQHTASCEVIRSEITKLVELDVVEFNTDFKVIADYAISITNQRANQSFSRWAVVVSIGALLVNIGLGVANYFKPAPEQLKAAQSSRQ